MIKVFGVLLPIFVLVFFENVKLILTYSKVSRWGANNTINFADEGRSNGQTFWSQRTNIQSESLRQPVYYHKSSSKLDNDNIDSVPAKGEVEERFNPRPYFDFVFNDPPKQNKPNNQPTTKKPSYPKATSPTIIYGTPVNIPLPKPPTDLYASPFSSYNPPDQKPNDFKIVQSDLLNFPPNNNQPSSTVPNTGKKPKKKIPSTSYGIPDSQLSQPATDSGDISSYNEYLPPIKENLNKPLESTQKPYFSDDEHDDNSYQRPMPEYEPPMVQTPMPPSQPQPTYLDHPPKNNVHSMPSMAEDDLSPPPEDTSFVKFPQYLDHDPHDHGYYNFHHDHDVYHEVHTTAATTTSTEAPRAGHYSYYYLGRKLWYIPLYFSIYFIVYVTVLILKSIARHKIQFSHHFDKGRSARQLDADVLNQTVMTAIDESRNKYM
ncbi:hypothetical protein RN001_015589 [Aquatica leii]|uniref:Uncharacterized protein n=1 Tax=Aquatica leii TaxID=1421715 RepID=A0AAN7NTH0_9COLE|nr:hypothetical protein RN001_015589 [Aquatica leii]